MMLTRSKSKKARRALVEQSSDLHPSSPLRPNPFDALATELIEKIFILAFPIVDLPAQNTDPAILSIVCRRWHGITTSYRSLWSTIDIDTSRINKKEWKQWGYSQLSNRLDKSASYPLTVRIHKSGFGDEDYVLIFPGIIDLLMVHSERWKAFKVKFPLEHQIIKKLNTLPGRLSLLESLDFRLPSHHSTTTTRITDCTFLSTPSLRCIGLGNSDFPMSVLRQISWKNLSEVTFTDAVLLKEDFYNVMECMSVSVTALSFVFACFTPFNSAFLPQDKRIVLPKVRKLRAQGMWDKLLNILICPSLDRLEVSDGTQVEIANFLKNSSCTLTYLYLCGFQDTFFSLAKGYEIFRSPSLATLRSIDIYALPEDFLDLLIFESCDKLFPVLKTLNLTLRTTREKDGIQDLPSRISLLRDIIQSRTQATSPIPPTSSTAIVPSDLSENNETPSALEHCFLTFELTGKSDPKVDGSYWDETLLEELRSFCISRNIYVELAVVFR